MEGLPTTCATLHHVNHGYDRRNDSCLEEIIANGVQRLQHDVPEQTTKIGDKINAAMAQENANSRSADNMMCGFERNIAEGQREVLNQVVQNRFESAKTESKLIERLDYESDLVKEKMDRQFIDLNRDIRDVKDEVKDSKCEVLNRIDTRYQQLKDQLSADKLDEKNSLIDELRNEKRNCELSFAIEKNNIAFSSQLQLLNSQLIDLSQAQKATNTAINFGTGLIGQTATQNQVR